MSFSTSVRGIKILSRDRILFTPRIILPPLTTGSDLPARMLGLLGSHKREILGLSSSCRCEFLCWNHLYIKQTENSPSLCLGWQASGSGWVRRKVMEGQWSVGKEKIKYPLLLLPLIPGSGQTSKPLSKISSSFGLWPRSTRKITWIQQKCLGRLIRASNLGSHIWTPAPPVLLFISGSPFGSPAPAGFWPCPFHLEGQWPSATG